MTVFIKMTNLSKIHEVNLPRPYLTDAELEMIWGGTPDSRYGKVKRLLAQETLLHLRRGLYALTKTSGYHGVLHPYELAQPIYSPSYISLCFSSPIGILIYLLLSEF